MTRLLTTTVDDTVMKHIKNLVRQTGKPEKIVIREVVETGLKSYQTTPTKGVKALLDLAQWANENNVTGPTNLSTNHNKYAWEE